MNGEGLEAPLSSSKIPLTTVVKFSTFRPLVKILNQIDVVVTDFHVNSEVVVYEDPLVVGELNKLGDGHHLDELEGR